MNKDDLAILIGENISRYREKNGLTQAQLAEKVSVGTAFISRIERGEKSMKIHTLYQLAEALKVSCDALLYRESPSTHLNTIHRLLENQSCSYLSGVEDLVHVCNEHFVEKGGNISPTVIK